jgi:hypothetical protein
MPWRDNVIHGKGIDKNGGLDITSSANMACETNDILVSDQGYHIPGGTVGYPAQPGLIRSSVRDSVCE